MASSHPPVPLVARGLAKRYGRAAALADVDVRVPAGRVVGLVGPNGSGKTTLLHVVAGLTRPDAGTAVVAGEPAGSRLARARVGLVPDEPAGFDELTVGELVALVHGLWRAGDEATVRARVLLDAFGLAPRAGQRLGSLSRGLRRQASIVAAFSLAPPLVLVDEATATLDPEAIVVLDEAMRALASRGCGVLLATQDLAFADASCDELVLLAQGRVVERGTPAELRERRRASSIEEVFLDVVGERGLRGRVRDDLAAL
ncbi:ABC-type multidrug transport system ATPase component [Gaiella occulta]|uniref:ABC-type multidrug transport system ATPase component n=1 Tax=Gaiella occulta TaxID=1002870 RepID=A0A7M2YWR7_9ACTN|nr:ABC transporter ATP-binding protein [Gaiella occulta]RDI74573.1 ABC-type multidrug transport system ATPase component [Gaiella occulta]